MSETQRAIHRLSDLVRDEAKVWTHIERPGIGTQALDDEPAGFTPAR